jgi:PIN domain nuclease of toxin-antitoxin system
LNEDKVVVDASVLLDFLLRRGTHEKIGRLLPRSVIPASALVEAMYIAIGEGYRGSTSELNRLIVGTGATVEPFIPEDAERAAELVAASRAMAGETQLSLGDALCIATAERLEMRVITEDAHWSSMTLTVPCISLRRQS